MFKKLQSKKGFTLIELMIVVAILGVLAAVAIPQYMNYIAATKARTGMSNHDAAVRLTLNEFKKRATGVYDATTNIVKDLNQGNRVNPYNPLSSAFVEGADVGILGQVQISEQDLSAATLTIDVGDSVQIHTEYRDGDGVTQSLNDNLIYE